ncbi:hypothetical protein HanRHA438_Chr08g0369581 [Helianthus annuus]|uniref:Uncharacterized protein n=1 Tax=Helianthus annuus TaxID=4232 RepID=A0A251UN43_HELAN|nr:hypothetical protein HanXRQr2_Chr08g0357471 [Helianthus annuus]KAJ0540169.1 hypothetical protein HanHA300_Chr08g0295151 [Helianthus annuus]KAJ0548630.1 hypothetical protein HanIR_Chr08g0385921 [Helianthus annuus]KAJ0554913.1 hypothetical protein HanHA89_Chr08g0313671 [Helianthus annuus]KAJ0720479.1 hypothetical protein HanLR1_Chr08g0294001 [Helianthus annuus]
MGKDVYSGKVVAQLYNCGVRAGALGLMVNSVVSGPVSYCNERLARWVGCQKRLWGGMNFLLAVCQVKTMVVTLMARSSQSLLRRHLRLIVVSLLSEQWNSLMGGGNMPSFAVGAVAAAFSGIIAFTMLPSPPPNVLAKVSGGGGMHPKIMISNKIFGFIRKF